MVQSLDHLEPFHIGFYWQFRGVAVVGWCCVLRKSPNKTSAWKGSKPSEALVDRAECEAEDRDPRRSEASPGTW